jgi:hypothetical protein
MIPGAKYVMIGKTGHLGPVTRPELWGRAIAEFVCEESSRMGSSREELQHGDTENTETHGEESR